MASNNPSSSGEPEEHPIYYLGRVGQRAQMTRASVDGSPPVLPPPARMLESRPQLPPISRLPEFQKLPSTAAPYAPLNPLTLPGASHPPIPPLGFVTTPGPPTWSAPTSRPPSRPPSSYSSHPALYPQRASFQSKNPGTVYEALSPIDYSPRSTSSLFSDAPYNSSPSLGGPVSTFENPRSAHRSSIIPKGITSPYEASMNQATYPISTLPLSHTSRPDMPQLQHTMQDRYILTVRQQPLAARACGFGERDRRVIDPPPVVQLSLKDYDPTSKQDLAELKFPFNIVHCTLISVTPVNQATNRPTSAPYAASGLPDADVTTTTDPQHHDRVSRKLMGNIFASPFVAIDPDAPDSNLQHARNSTFFIFPDLSCRQNGRYRLRFTLMKVPMGSETPDGGQGSVYGSIESDIFQVYSAKDFPGMTASSKLIRELKKQGAAVNVRKGKDKGQSKELGKRVGGDVSGNNEEELEQGATARKKRG